jgi:copper transport protein
VSTLEVLDAGGRRVDKADGQPDPADPWQLRVSLPSLPAGAYTVAWRVLSADDGHLTEGAQVFVVGDAPGGPAAMRVERGLGLRTAGRWLAVSGGAILLGILAARPVLGLPPAGPGSGRWLELIGGAGVLAGGVLDLGLLAHELAPPGARGRMLLAVAMTPSGVIWLVRGAGLLALAALWGLRPVSGRRWPEALRGALAAGIILVGALVSHSAATVEGRPLALGAEAIHLLAMAVWVGGLLAFATVFWQAPTPARDRRLVLAIPAFSQLAVWMVGALALTGFALARLHLSAWHELLDTPYGRLLAVKLLVFAAMLLVATGHLRRHAALLSDGTGGAEAHVRRRLRLEAGLGVAALALAAALGSTRPPDPRPDGGLDVFREQAVTPEAALRLELRPFRPGPVTVTLAVSDRRGWPLADARAALLQLVPHGGGVGPLTLDLERTAPGVFAARAAALGMAGEWEGRLVVQREGAYDVNHRFTIVVPAALGPAPRRFALDRTTGLAAALIAFVTVTLFLRSRARLKAARVLLAQPRSGSPDVAKGDDRV